MAMAMEALVEGPADESVAAEAVESDTDQLDSIEETGATPNAEEASSSSAVNADNNDNDVVGSGGGAEKDDSGSQAPDHDNDSLGDIPTPQSPINYAELNADETPYEHNFEPGDHVIRWDMLPILWPIQIHGIVLEVSEDKSEVTICDFGITSVKSEDKKVSESQTGGDQSEKIVEEENAKFNEAIKDEGEPTASGELSGIMTKWHKNKKNNRLNIIKLTKWSDLRKWHKVNYEGGILNAGKGGVGKSLKDFGKKTEELWNSMTTSFRRSNSKEGSKSKVWLSVRYDVDDNGFCVHHPDIQLKRLKDDGEFAVVRKKCPQCIKEDCPAMLGDGSSIIDEDSSDSQSTKESTEDVVQTIPTNDPKTDPDEASLSSAPEQSSQISSAVTNESSPELRSEDADDTPSNSNSSAHVDSESVAKNDDPKSLAQMIADANEVEKQSRKKVGPLSPERKPAVEKQQSWGGSLVKSLSTMFTKKNEEDASANIDSKDDDMATKGESKQEEIGSEKGLDKLPKSDPAILVIARTRFILEHGEDILPPYHIINSNSECIAVFCKTGRWSTLQASVFLHSTAIGHAKSATALTLGVAATNPFLIPVFATVGLAAVGTPWLFLKVANDKWYEATMSLNEKFWMQAEPEVFVECIEKWGNIK